MTAIKMKSFIAAAAMLAVLAAPVYYYEDRGADHIPGTAPASFSMLKAGDPSATTFSAIDAAGRMLQPGEGVAIVGLTLPTSVTWNPEGTNIYVSEKSGVVKLFHTWQGSGVGAANIVMDLSERVTSWGDHGLTMLHYSELGGTPYIYATYMKRNPVYGNECGDHGQMDGRPLDQVNGCEIWGIFSRFPVHADGSISADEEEVILDTESRTVTDIDGNIVNNGCSQFSTHSVPVAVVELGGYFFTSLGDGAAFTLVDAGQLGPNPCEDNPQYRGAFRSQDPTRLNGKILRWTPAPAAADFEFEIWTTGHRNPFRMSADPENNRMYATETGWYTTEEVNMILPDESFKGTNMGWPCYEGPRYAPEYMNFFNQNPYCTSIPNNSTFYYDDPLDTGNGKPPCSISAVAGAGGRLYYGDLSLNWVRSIAFEDVQQFPFDLFATDKWQVEATNVFPCQLVMTPRGMAYVDHFPGAITSLPGVIGQPVPSPAPPPPPPFTSVHTSNGNSWVAGQAITMDKQSNIEGREGAEWTWTATLLADCTPTDDCTAAELARQVTGGLFTFTAPQYPGTIEVRASGRTYGGMNSTAYAYLVGDAAESPCMCTGQRTVAAAVPSFSPSAAPIIKANNKPLVDTKSTGFIAGVATAGAVVGLALLGVGVWAGMKAARSKTPSPITSRLANSNTNTTSTEKPMATNPAQRVASSDGESRADRAKRAGFAPQQAGQGTAQAPAFSSPTAAARTGARAV